MKSSVKMHYLVSQQKIAFIQDLKQNYKKVFQ
jgi:hypothetical protein